MEGDGVHQKLFSAIRNNQPSEVRSLLSSRPLDLTLCRGDALREAIELAGVEVVAELLEVEYPLRRKRVDLPCEIYSLLNNEFDFGGRLLTPLMAAARLGKYECLSLLLSCGGEVNAQSHNLELAIDFSMEQDDPRVALLLFQKDSLLPNLTCTDRKNKFQSFLKRSPELQSLFNERAQIHELIMKRTFDSAMKEVLEREDCVYYVNINGESAVFSAAVNENYDAWGFLTAKGMKCASYEEMKLDRKISSNNDMFTKAIEKHYCSIEGCHVYKMVSKSIVLGKKRSLEKFSKKVEGYFRHLDEEEMTSVLLQVLQDHGEFKIAFEFDRKDLRRMTSNCPFDAFGLMDPKINRVYVTAMETSTFCYRDVVSNLAHELAHKAMFVVFQNEGLPYRKEEGDRENEYRTICRTMTSEQRIKRDKILQRVNNYEEDRREKELIVRVPEMIAKYKGLEHDGVFLLKQQALELLKYYENVVMPELIDYVKKIFTSSRITGRALISYQNLLSVHQKERVQIEQKEKELEYCLHNELNVLKVSNLKLGQSHLKARFHTEDKNVVFVDWNQFLKCKELFLRALELDEIQLMAVIWDRNQDPTFCEHQTCWSKHCPAYHFGTMTKCVVLLLDRDVPNLKNNKTIEYTWGDLSGGTKELILEKVVDFGGSQLTLKEILCVAAGNKETEAFCENFLGATDISYLLEEPEISFGIPMGWSIGNQACKIFLNHPDCFLRRSLSHRCVKLSTSLLQKKFNHRFLVTNVEMADLLKLGINKNYISTWKSGCYTDYVRCYVTGKNSDSKDEYTAFEEIVSNHSFREKGIKSIHFLKFHNGKFYCVKSSEPVHAPLGGEKDGTLNEVKDDLAFPEVVEDLMKDSGFTCDDLIPVVIADDPGCGKSVFLNRFAIDLKNTLPSSWIVLVDFKLYASWRYFDKSRMIGTNESLELLYQMTRKTETCLERKLFDSYSQVINKIVVLFDGFDEICPIYREPITSFLKILKENTRIKIYVTTRLHEKHDLEESLNGVSYKLIPFSSHEQVEFLDKYWNALLKNLLPGDRLEKLKTLKSGMEKWLKEEGSEEGNDVIRTLNCVITEYEKVPEFEFKVIDFKPVVRKLLFRSKLVKVGAENFTQIPLHIQTIGYVLFDDFLSIGENWNLGLLYQRIFDMKMEIFHSEKCKAQSICPAEKTARMVKTTASKTLEKLSSIIFQSGAVYDLPPEDLENALAIGLLTEKLDGQRDYQFVHRTFCEFFYAKWLLRKANQGEVAKIWLHELFFEERLSRVSLFVEDILSLKHREMVISYKSKISSLKAPSDFPKSELKVVIHKCIYSLILDCQTNCLEFFVTSFGESVVNLFFEDVDVDDWQLKEGLRLTMALRNYRSYYSGFQKLNSFTFASYCLQKVTLLSPDRYIAIVRRMFALVGEQNLDRAMNEILAKRGMGWILPFVHEQKHCVKYLEAIVEFFTGKQRETFRETLRSEFLGSYYIWFSVIGEGVELFNIMTSLADAILDDSGYETMLLESSDFFELWVGTVRYRKFEKVKHVWGYVKDRLKGKDLLLQFLKRKGYKNYNVLTQAVMNKDERIVGFVWDLANSLMDPDERRVWLKDSFNKGKPRRLDCKNTPSKIYNFFKKLLNMKALTDSDLSDLLLPEEITSNRYFLTFRCFYDLVESLLSFHNLFSCHLKGSARNILLNMDFYYAELICWLTERKFTHLVDNHKCRVEEEFEKITNSNQFIPIDVLRVDEKGFLEDDSWKDIRAETFKSFIVALHRCIQLDHQYLGADDLLGRLKSPRYSGNGHHPNILHHLLEVHFPFRIGYISAILMMYLDKKDFEGLLFEGDYEGNTVFHISAKDKDLKNWENYYDVARVLLKEQALATVHVVTNQSQRRVLDILYEHQPNFTRNRRYSSMSDRK